VAVYVKSHDPTPPHGSLPWPNDITPRWHSTLAATDLGPLVLTFYQGDEPVRWVHFGGSAIASCDEEVFCVGERVSASVV